MSEIIFSSGSWLRIRICRTITKKTLTLFQEVRINSKSLSINIGGGIKLCLVLYTIENSVVHLVSCNVYLGIYLCILYVGESLVYLTQLYIGVKWFIHKTLIYVAYVLWTLLSLTMQCLHTKFTINMTTVREVVKYLLMLAFL